MANVSQLIRRQSSRELAAQKSLERLELELESRLVPTVEEIPDYGSTNHSFDGKSPLSENKDTLRRSAKGLPKGKSPGLQQGPDGQPEEERESWDSKLQFLLATVGYAVGLGNVWRFPYLAQKNGGGAFLIPYFIMLAFLGLPVFYLELAVGQRIRRGALGAWNMISINAGGVGVASAVVSFTVAIYYNTVISWCLYYLFQSFQLPLPWINCRHAVGVVDSNETSLYRECEKAGVTQYFWYRDALDISGDIGDPGEFNWKICGCTAIAWLLIYICIMKGIVASGKVVYVTAIFPYMVLIMFFIRGVTLRGMTDGLLYLFTPRWEKLADPVVWLEAGTQIFFSLGLAFGGLIAFGSYNPVDNNCLRDALLVSFTNCFTSLFSALVVFSILGFQAHETHDRCLEARHSMLQSMKVPLEDDSSVLRDSDSPLEFMSFVPKDIPKCDLQEELQKSSGGTGLAFMVFAEAVSQFPFPPMWAILFFLMLFTLGADSQFGTLEGVISALTELRLFPSLRKEILTGIVCFICFLLSLMFTHGAGNYILQLFDAFAGNIPLLVIAFFECITVSYVYGIKRFAGDLEIMCGSRPSIFWLVCWKIISPFIMLAILTASFVKMAMEGSTYQAWDSQSGESVEKEWPPWAWCMAGLLVLLPLIWIPVVPIANLFGFKLVPGEDNEVQGLFLDKDFKLGSDVSPQRFSALERALLCISTSSDSIKSTEDVQTLPIAEREELSRSPSPSQLGSKKRSKTNKKSALKGAFGSNTLPSLKNKPQSLSFADGKKALRRARSEEQKAKKGDRKSM